MIFNCFNSIIQSVCWGKLLSVGRVAESHISCQKKKEINLRRSWVEKKLEKEAAEDQRGKWHREVGVRRGWWMYRFDK